MVIMHKDVATFKQKGSKIIQWNEQKDTYFSGGMKWLYRNSHYISISNHGLGTFKKKLGQ